MRAPILTLFAAVLAAVHAPPVHGDSIDGRVTQVVLPAEDVTLYYVESRSVFTVKLKTESASVEGQRLYLGDGKIAVDLVAHATAGIFLQGIKYRQGDQFKKGSIIRLQAVPKKASELRPGDVYVVLPGVRFQFPGS